ncbi:MAG: 50S ribosomal protein L18e [bacterium]|nr:50S ribosomal protein L18e [bacterium]
MKTGTTNVNLKSLIDELKKKSFADNSLIWKRIAKDLEKPTRNRRAVNLSRINRFTKKDETIVVPGKVLAAGELDHSLTIAAWQFSQQAIDKITKANAKALSINDIMKQDIKGKKVRILG